MSQRDDFKRTIVYGDIALSHLKRSELPAVPRNYELWYTYAAGFNQALNRSINHIFSSRGSISAREVSDAYDRFLSPNRLGDRIDKVGAEISQEIDGIVGLMDTSLDATGDFGASLEGAKTALSTSTTPAQLKKLISKLAEATRRTETTNRELENQLKDTRTQISALQERLEAIRYESLTDELTTLSNRKHFDQSIERSLSEATEAGEPLALLLSDIDHFKNFNDTYGHQTGDQVLRLVALAFKQNIKNEDLACRYGGEEFAVILPRADMARAYDIAERIRKSVISKELVKRSTGENLGRITISIGVSCIRRNDTPSELIARADEALYAAKDAGRNLVKCEKDANHKAAVA